VSKTVVVWIDEPASIEIIDGIARCCIASGDKTYELRGKPSTLLASLRIGGMAYAAFAGKAATDVLLFKPKKAKKRRH
jgi:hypothetical protein